MKSGQKKTLLSLLIISIAVIIGGIVCFNVFALGAKDLNWLEVIRDRVCYSINEGFNSLVTCSQNDIWFPILLCLEVIITFVMIVVLCIVCAKKKQGKYAWYSFAILANLSAILFATVILAPNTISLKYSDFIKETFKSYIVETYAFVGFGLVLAFFICALIFMLKMPKEKELMGLNDESLEAIRQIVREELKNIKVTQQVIEKVEETPVIEEKKEFVRISFAERLAQSETQLHDIYNEIKNEILSYGVKSRVSNAGDIFRLHRKTYIKIMVSGKNLKVFFALNPNDYKDSTIPVIDAGDKDLYKEIPVALRVKSELSIKRCKQLIADCLTKDGMVQGEVKNTNWFKQTKDTIKK